MMVNRGGIKMWQRLISVGGVMAAFICFTVAAMLHPGGYDLNRDYLSTLLRDTFAPARVTAVTGMLVLCISLALAFNRLARATAYRGISKTIQIGGIGSAVYAALAFTPMHDLMVLISVVFFAIAMFALLFQLTLDREFGFLAGGTVCYVLLIISTAIYYSNLFVALLPWAQRILILACASWLLALDLRVSRQENLCDFNTVNLAAGTGAVEAFH